MRTVHLTITGRVQGVGYRAFVVHHAERLGLAGWVRNRYDGSVEAVLSGPGAVIGDALEALRRGPPGSRVTGIAEMPHEEPASSDFTVLPTV